MVATTVIDDPISMFVLTYFNYILFAIGLFLLLWGARKWYEDRNPNVTDEEDDNADEA